VVVEAVDDGDVDRAPFAVLTLPHFFRHLAVAERGAP
jgi:hypothetical protein